MAKKLVTIPFLIFFILYLFLAVSAFAAPADLLPFEDLTPGNLTGFGDSWNRYAWSMAEYNGDIYVGTFNQKVYLLQFIAGVIKSRPVVVDNPNLFYKEHLGNTPVTSSKGGEIWKYSIADNSWTQIVNNGYNDTKNIGYRTALRYRDAVYFGSANYKNGSQLLAITDHGSTVKVLEPLEDSLKKQWYANDSSRSMVIYNDILYIGKENTGGAEVWAYDGKALQLAHKFKELSVGDLCVFGDYLYVGMWDDSGMRLYRMQISPQQKLMQLDDMTPPELIGTNNTGIISQAVFKDKLFIGTMNDVDGFTLISIGRPDAEPGNQADYRILNTNGFGDKFNLVISKAEVDKAFDRI